MKKLINFELKKIFYKRNFIIVITLIILTSFLTVFFMNKKEYNETYIYIHKEKILSKSEYKKIYPKYHYDNYKKQMIKKNKYINENNKKYEYTIKNKKDYKNKSKNILEKSYTLLMFLALIIVITSGQMMSKEFSKKTINGILLTPYKRYKIFLSKFIALLIISLIYCVFLILMMFMFTLVFGGLNELLIPSLKVVNNNAVEVNYLLLFLKNYFILLIPIIFIIILCYVLSTITNNAAISVSLGLFINITAIMISTFLLSLNVPLIDLTFLPYLDYTIFMDKINITNFNIENNCNLNITKATIVLFVYGLIFYLITNLVFNKKDITC